MKFLQMKRLSVNSNSLDYSLWVKGGQTFLNLFIGGNRVIVFVIFYCSKWRLTFRSRLYDTFPIAGVFQYTFVETFTTKFMFIRGDAIAAVCLTT